MKKYLVWIFTALLAVVMWGCNENAVSTEDQVTDELTLDQRIAYAQAVLKDITGNGAPSGAHYNLNLIGVNDKDAEMDGNNGHRIFVKLWGKTKILLYEGDDFGVLDANGTDSDGAAFQLPNPDPDGDGTTVYSVFARALGKPYPDNETTMTTCATETQDFDGDGVIEEYCSLYSAVFVRDRGKSWFDNVTRELLYIYADLDGDGIVERYPLFDDALQDYYWSYDNNGLKVVQLRFYEVPTTVPEP